MKQAQPLAVFAALCLCSAGCVPAQQSIDTSRLGQYEYRSHFQPNPGASPDSGSRDGWESFPLSQEAGYDPSIQPETSQGKSALVRELAPTRDGPFQLGFIRRVHAIAGTNASFRVRVRVPYLLGTTTIRLSVFHGEKEEPHDVSIRGADWHQLQCLLQPSPLPVTAIAIAVDFPHAIHGRVEKVVLAEVRLKALAIKRLPLNASQAFWDPSRELDYLRRAMHPGDDLSIDAEPGDQKAIHWTLTTPSGERIAHGEGANVHYHFPANSVPGIWSLNLLNTHASTTALVLVRPAQAVGLLFDAAPAISPLLLASIRERRALLEKTVQPDTGRNVVTMDPHWLLAGLPSYFSIILQPSELAMLDAIEFRASGDPAALDRSRKLLASIARWPMWVHPWFPAHGYHSYYPIGIMTKYVVMAEQFLGSDLPEDERRKLDQSLIEQSVKPIYEEYVLEDRLQFNTSNWIGNTVGGALLAALQSNDTDAAAYALGLFIKERDHVLAAYTADGSYGEGVTYHRFDLEMTSLVAEATKRLLGTSIDQLLLEGDRYMRYAAYGKDGVLDYGDSHVDITPSNVFAYVAAQNRSAATTDFYFKYRDQGTPELLSRVLWEASIKPANTPPPDPPSRLFDQRGIVVLRDGWDQDATVIAMRAGKNFNHNHADQGSLFYARGGTLWLGEAGYADYYKDPSYPTFNIQAIGHNTLLVDGNGESQVLPGNAVFGSAPSITHSLIGPEASLIQADLTSVYPGVFERYTRSLFFLQDGSLMVIDQVRSRLPHIVTQVWHPKRPVVFFNPKEVKFRMADDHSQVEVQTFGLSSSAMVERPSPLPLLSYEQAEQGIIERPMRVEISNAVPSSTETIVTLIRPSADGNKLQPRPEWSTDTRSQTLQLGEASLSVHHAPGHSAASINAWWKNGALLIDTTQYDDRVSGQGISASNPIDLSLRRTPGGEVNVEIDAGQPTELTLRKLVLPAGACDASAGCRASSPHALAVAAGHTLLRLLPQDAQTK